MKDPFNSTDPLLRAVVEDEESMSLAAAADVRRRLHKRRKLRRNAIAAAMIVGVSVILSFWMREAVRTGRPGFGRNPDANRRLVSSNHANTSPVAVSRFAAPPREGFVKAYSVDSQIADDLSHAAITEQERSLLKELRDQPTLIVWNAAGQLSRVHVFEKSP